MSHTRLRSVARCAEEFVKPVACYGFDTYEGTAVTDLPAELELLTVALKSPPSPCSLAAGGTAPSL